MERNTQGIGLGLVISKMITQEFGGQVRMKSRHRVGSKFQSSFGLNFATQPVALSVNKQAAMLGRKLQKFQSMEFNDSKILVVDDDPFNVFSLKQLISLFKIEDWESQIVTAFNGKEAVKAIEMHTQ